MRNKLFSNKIISQLAVWQSEEKNSFLLLF